MVNGIATLAGHTSASKENMKAQVELEQSRLMQPLARIHYYFATSTGKINSCSGSPVALITSSEIAKIARIGIPAVQKQYILRVSIHAG